MRSVLSEIVWSICLPRGRHSLAQIWRLRHSLKVKAIMLIVMLSVAEGHRIPASSSYRAASQSGGVVPVMADPPSQEHVKLSARQVAGITGDPKFQEHLVEQMKEDSKHQERIESAMADLSPKELVKLMQPQREAMRAAPRSSAEVSRSNGRACNKTTGGSNQNRRGQGVLVTQMMDALIEDPALQQQAVFLAQQVERMRDVTNNEEEATLVVERVKAMMTDPSLHAQAQLVAKEMVAAEHMVARESNAMRGGPNFSMQAKLVVEQVEATKAEPLALVEINRSSGQGIIKPILVQVVAPALTVKPGLASRTMTSPVSRPALSSGCHPVSVPSRTTSVSGRPTMKHGSPWMPASENKAGRVQWMSMTGIDDKAARPLNSEKYHVGPKSNTYSSAFTSAKGLKTFMPAFAKTLSSRNLGLVMSDTHREKRFPVDGSLLLYLAIYYVFNLAYNIEVHRFLSLTGNTASFPMTVATLELGVSAICALFLWIGPGARQRPNMSFKDYMSTLPSGLSYAGLQVTYVLALSLGSVSFTQIISASAPAMAAAIGTCLYGHKLSIARWLTLIPVIGGVIVASIGEVNFAIGALVTATLANVFTAFWGNEVEKFAESPSISERIGSVGNHYAITTINAFLFTLPLMLLTEGRILGQFLTLMTKPAMLNKIVASGVSMYISDRLLSVTIKKMGLVTNVVARTALRVAAIIGASLVLKESLGVLKLAGASITIGGAFLYTIIDQLVEARKRKRIANPPALPSQPEDTAPPSGKPNERKFLALFKEFRRRVQR